MNFYEMLIATVHAACGVQPEAELYECQSTNGVDHVHSVFRGTDNTTLEVKAFNDGRVSDVAVIDSPWLEDVVIHFPLKLTLFEATELIYAKGYRGDWYQVVLRNPLGPTKWGEGYVLGANPNNPKYIFSYHGDIHVAVDTFTKEVTPLELI